MAKGLPSEYIEAILIGADLDVGYIKQLTHTAQSLTGKTIILKVQKEIDAKGVKDCLLVWQKKRRKIIARLQAVLSINTGDTQVADIVLT